MAFNIRFFYLPPKAYFYQIEQNRRNSNSVEIRLPGILNLVYRLFELKPNQIVTITLNMVPSIRPMPYAPT